MRHFSALGYCRGRYTNKMTAWGHIQSIFSHMAISRHSRSISASGSFLSGLFSAIASFASIVLFLLAPVFANIAEAAPSTNKVINFQGRLQTRSGAIVADGNYNMQFKIYQGGSGAVVGNTDGALAWTESYVNNGGSQGIRVRNGVFSVQLGSVTSFGSSVDWNQDVLWLSMNIAGTAGACTSFGTAPCVADGEMLPMSRITSVPNALNSNAVGGKTAENLVQLAQGVQTDASSNTSSIFINKTGTGNLIQLQNAATDIFTISNSGNLALGSNSDKTISIDTSDNNEDGKKLSVIAGFGGAGSGASGGDLVLQGGNAGGTNGDAGNLQIDAGVATGTGASGSISIGETNAGSISIGSGSVATDQTIAIGANNTAGSNTDVTIGSGGNAAGGSTTIQAKDSVAIATNGTDRLVVSGDTNTVYFGNGVSSSAPDNYTLQGTNSSAANTAGGSLIMQGGNATTGNANGGDIVLAGGSGSGSGFNGLVVLSTPAFSTVTNDANCYTGGSVVASSCTISSSSVNNSSAVVIGFSAPGQTATVPDPANITAGRIMYVMGATGSQDFKLSVNGGGANNETTMRSNSTTTLLWNGSDWSLPSGPGATNLQSAYEGTPQNAGGTELVLNSTPTTSGLTIRDGGSNPGSESLLQVKDSQSNNLLSINNRTPAGSEHTADGSVGDADNFGVNWSAVGDATVSRSTLSGQAGDDSARIDAGLNIGNGVRNKLLKNPATETNFRASFYARIEAGSNMNDITVRYSPDGGVTFIDCTDYNTQDVGSDGWTQITCTIATGVVAVTDPYLYIIQPTSPAESRIFMIDTLSFVVPGQETSNVRVGSGQDGEDATLFTVDKSAGAPVVGNHEGLLGSLYYDTVIGRLQCYEAEGWGNCGASPDSFITLSPEYASAVTHGEGVGDFGSGFCSDTLDINDGSSSQPNICGTNETYNFYHWTSPEVTTQNKSIFVTYRLPDNFKEFVPSSVSLMGRTDDSESSVSYSLYKNNDSGLTPCGSSVSVSSGVKTIWQKAAAVGASDPEQCDFVAGDSIVFRIELNTANDHNAYVSNLGFAFSILQ